MEAAESPAVPMRPGVMPPRRCCFRAPAGADPALRVTSPASVADRARCAGGGVPPAVGQKGRSSSSTSWKVWGASGGASGGGGALPVCADERNSTSSAMISVT